MHDSCKNDIMVLEMGATEMGGSGTSSVSTLFLLRSDRGGLGLVC